jgi:ubiquinone/menaquinone biosynthesis C-methylase UbiE
MGRLMAAVYDRFMRQTEEACLLEWRRELFRGLHGAGLEVGAGTGVSLDLYPETVTRLVLSEPDDHMREKLRERLGGGTAVPAELSDASLDSLPFPDSSFDFVVSVLVLCSVDDLSASLAEVRRVLAPGGQFAFIEHVAAEDRPRRLRWQRRIEPLWKRLSGNCHLTRRTERAILDQGFEIAQIRRESLRKATPLVRPSIRGIAVNPG